MSRPTDIAIVFRMDWISPDWCMLRSESDSSSALWMVMSALCSSASHGIVVLARTPMKTFPWGSSRGVVST